MSGLHMAPSVHSVLLSSVHPSPALARWSWLSGTRGWSPQLSWHTANHCTIGKQAAYSLEAFSSIAEGCKGLSYRYIGGIGVPKISLST